MALKSATWVHGTIVEPERPEKLQATERTGYGSRFRGSNHFNWFHFPPTTPVILDGTRTKLSKVFVFYNTQPKGAPSHSAFQPTIKSIHLWDGPRRVKTIDGLSLTGDHSAGIDAHNSWTLSPPLTIMYGLGISVGVQFPSDDPDVHESYDIQFITAGGDFTT